MNPSLSIYDNLGGEKGVRALVEAFYPIVQQNGLTGSAFPGRYSAGHRQAVYVFVSVFWRTRAVFRGVWTSDDACPSYAF